MIIIILLLLAVPALAQEIPVNVRAEQLKYIEESGIIEASGSVEVQINEVTIYSDFLQMDSTTNVATAEGNVRVMARSYSANADYIVYDASSEVTVFDNFKSAMTTKKVKGNVYLSVKKLCDLKEKMLGESGSLTTCEDPIPHFFVIADRIEYYPNDKMIGQNATVYVGVMPVLWLPYLYYDMQEEQKRNWVLGHNEVEGDYIKSAWGMPWGLLYLDQMQKKGFGHGIATNYAFLGLGSLYLYHLDEQDTNLTDWVTRLDHSKNITPWTTLKLHHSYSATYLIPSGRKDQTVFNMDLNHKKDKTRWRTRLNTLDNRISSLQKYALTFNQSHQKTATNYYLNYDFSKKDPRWIRSSQRLNHRPLWSNKVMLTTRANYYNSVASGGAPGDERLEPMIEITGKEKVFSWSYRENWYIDLDGDTYTGDNAHQYMEKLPEIEISPRPLDLKLFSLRPSFGYGHYHEVRYVSQLGRNRDYSTQRYRATLNASRSIPLALGTVAVLGMGLDQFQYAPGDQLYAYREKASLRTKLFGFFKNNISAKKGRSEGNTPFLFDRLGTRYHNFNEKMTFYYKNKVNWNTTGGYNWITDKWNNVMTKLLIKPKKGIYWSLRTGWDIENTMYKNLVNTLRLNPHKAFSLRFSTVSDMNQGRLRSGSALYDILFLHGQPNQWRLRFSQVYDSATQQFRVRDIMVVKDLHCWELKYTYSDYRKDFSLIFSLKALPDKPAGLSTGRGFYFDGFEEEISKLKESVKKEGAIRRY